MTSDSRNIEHVIKGGEIILHRDLSVKSHYSEYPGVFTLGAIHEWAEHSIVHGVSPDEHVWFTNGAPEKIYVPVRDAYDLPPKKVEPKPDVSVSFRELIFLLVSMAVVMFTAGALLF